MNLRLLKDDALFRVEPCRKVVGNDLNRILGDLRCVRVIAGQRMPVGNEVEAVVLRIVLQPNPILQRAKIMPDVQPSRGTHPADYALGLCGGRVRQTAVSLESLLRERRHAKACPTEASNS